MLCRLCSRSTGKLKCEISLPMISHNLDKSNYQAMATRGKMLDRSHDSRPRPIIDNPARVLRRKDFERDALAAMQRCTEPFPDQANKYRAIWQIYV